MSALYDLLLTEGEAGLQALIDGRQQEHVQLDFKRKTDPQHGSPNDDDKRTLGEALSGFSNSAGGLLIWGVDARKGPDGVDCAQALEPILDVQKFGSSITSLVGQFLMPRHEGVRIAVLVCATQPGAGYLLVDVERSDRRPHRSEAKNKRGYFKRVGDSFFEMEHYDIEDAFNRIHVPSLEIAWRADKTALYGNDREGGFDAAVTLQVRNSSTRTAKYPYLYVRRPMGANLKNMGATLGMQGFRVVSEGDWIYFVGGADHVINPETRASITSLAIEVRPNSITGAPHTINGTPFEAFSVVIDYKHGCEDSRLHAGSLTLTGVELLQALG